jgi:hypothetical protein
MDKYMSGSSETTTVGYVNRNHQLCVGHRGTAGTDHGQVSYRMLCMRTSCGSLYGANGTDVFQRRCPDCQGGAPGLPF